MKRGGKAVWMTRTIMAAVRKKKRMWETAKETGRMEEYRQYDKKVRRMIREAKNKFEKKIADGGNSKAFYAYIKKKSKGRSAVGPLKNEKQEIVTDDGEMANLLNDFFSSVFTRENGAQTPPAEATDAPAMSRVRITEWEVRKKIRRLRQEAATGPDEMGPRLLQELENELAKPLTAIFRASMETGEVPEDWKKANVVPIHKKGPKSEAGNYRPVSLTSVCCKVMESVLRDQMMGVLNRNNLIRDSQHGFMNGRSCCTNLLEFLEKVTHSLDGGRPMDIVYLDFAKAFDKVPRERLINKVRAHGIHPELVRWIDAWLTGRHQRVVLNGRHSEWREVLSGVPQGSVLGPILFLIFINDLDGAARLVDVLKKFADDTKLGKSVVTDDDRQQLQQALDEMCAWADKWGMAFNVAKCKVMHVGHNNPRYQYSMKGDVLKETTEEVDIGVTVAANLKPGAQCRKAARTAQTVLAQLSRAFHFRDRNVFMRLYTTYVRPHLEFSVPAWSPSAQMDIDCLEKVQKRAVGMVSGLKGGTYAEKLLELGMVTLEERRHQLDMLQVFKIIKGKDRVAKDTWFQSAGDGARNTRATADPLNLRIPAHKLEIRRTFFSQRVPALWNAVPTAIKALATAQAFKHAYRAHRRDLLAAAR